MYENCHNNCPAYYEDCEGQGCELRKAEKQAKCKLPLIFIFLLLKFKKLKIRINVWRLSKFDKLPF